MRPESRPHVCFVGIAPTVGDTGIGQSILQRIKDRLDLPVRVHTQDTEIFAALPELDDADEVLPALPTVAPRRLHRFTLPAHVLALLRDIQRTGGARLLSPRVFQQLQQALHRCAALIFQGGPNWNDRWMTGTQALRRWLLLQVARHHGARIYHVGVSCGPFAWPWQRRLWLGPLCRAALDSHDLLIVRDRFSAPALRRLGVSAPVIASTDAAVFLTPRADPRFAAVEHRIAQVARRRVVVCLRDFQPRYPDALAARDHVLFELARVLDHVQANLGQVFFLSTDQDAQPSKQSDVQVARRLQHMMKTSGSIIIDADVRDAAALKHLYSRFDLMISMRLHPTIFALDHGVPCLLLAYDDKCRDFFASLDLQQDAVPLTDFQAEPAMVRVEQMLMDGLLPSRIRDRYGELKRRHQHDDEPMFQQIRQRAAVLDSGPASTEQPAPQPALWRAQAL